LCVVDDLNVTAVTRHVNKKKPSGVFFLKMVEIKKKKGDPEAACAPYCRSRQPAPFSASDRACS
jgi:hypothetical protein